MKKVYYFFLCIFNFTHSSSLVGYFSDFPTGNYTAIMKNTRYTHIKYNSFSFSYFGMSLNVIPYFHRENKTVKFQKFYMNALVHNKIGFFMNTFPSHK